ncbi:MAG: hypothetical protein WCQ49_01675 [Candidatus Saccharibacteria bacterium]
MPENKHLNEQSYLSMKKKLNIIALGIMVIAIVVGLGLIIIPRLTTAAPIVEPVATSVAEYKTLPQSDIQKTAFSDVELQAQIDAIEAEYTKSRSDYGWIDEQIESSERVGKLQESNRAARSADTAVNEARTLALNGGKSRFDFESEANSLKFKTDFAIGSSKNKSDFGIAASTMLGAFIMFAGAIISGSLLYYANFRKFAAFGVQTIMPVAKEGITEIAPTIGAAYGSMVEAAAPGVSRGAGTMIDGTSPSVGRATNTILTSAAPGIGEIAREIKKGINEKPHKKHKK